jgi:hypothetical protein
VHGQVARVAVLGAPALLALDDSPPQPDRSCRLVAEVDRRVVERELGQRLARGLAGFECPEAAVVRRPGRAVPPGSVMPAEAAGLGPLARLPECVHAGRAEPQFGVAAMEEQWLD